MLSPRSYFKGRAYIKIILKIRARSYFRVRSYFRGNTIRANRLKGAFLKDVKNLQKSQRGSYDVAVDTDNDVAVVRWKDNKVD